MSIKNISLEFYPQTITHVLLDDPRVPNIEVTKVRDHLGEEETRLWTCRPRHSKAHTCLITGPSNLISMSLTPSRSFVSRIESKLPRIEVTKLEENMGEKETRNWLNSTIRYASSEYELSTNGHDTAEARSLRDLPLPCSIHKKDKSGGRQHRVGFQLKSKERIYFDRHRVSPFVSIASTVPSHLTPKRTQSNPHPSKRHSFTNVEGIKKKKEAVSRIHQLVKDWRLESALERAKRQACLNQRQRTEMRFHDQRALFLDATAQQMQTNKNAAKILIIGAGLAGISAAHKLLSLKFINVTVLEALDRFGGRIHTIANDIKPGTVIEMGAPGLHHFEPWNSVYTLAKQNKLMTTPVQNLKSENMRVHNCQGTIFSPHNRERAHLLSQELESTTCVVKRLNDISRNTGINLSYKDYVREKTRRVYKRLSEEGEKKEKISDLFCQVGCFIHEGLFRLGNSKGTVAIQHLESDLRDSAQILRLPDGMSSLFTPLMKHFKKNTVEYKCQVKSIDWSSSHEHDLRKGRDLIVKVTCKNGQVFTANHVIVTLPLGFLKKHARSLFIPELPELKLQAIERLGFASVGRVFVHFAIPFWAKSSKFIWTDDIDSDSNPCCKDALIFTVRADDTAIEVTTAGTYLDDACDSYLKRLLTAILASFYQKDIPDPVKITRFRWSTNPYFGGTHPYMSQASSKSDVAELAAPIHFLDTPIVLFAGDATYESYSCLTHAARASGLREAIRINTFYNHLHKFQNKN